MRYLIVTTVLMSMPALADQAQCESDARAAMLDIDHPVAMRQEVTTEMAGAAFKSAALSTPGRRGMALDANGTPTSLWIGGRFYTSVDGGETWSLFRETSAEDIAKQDADREKQAEAATDINCSYGETLDGKTVNVFQLSYEMTVSGIPVNSRYWIDADTGFPWKAVHDFGGEAPSVITQLNTPDPDLLIDDPGQ